MEYRGVLCGNRGPFTGRKMAVEDFLKTYPQGTLDIMDETYGYRQVKLDGFLNLTGRCLEFRLELYYSGEFRYLLKEPAPGAACLLYTSGIAGNTTSAVPDGTKSLYLERRRASRHWPAFFGQQSLHNHVDIKY